MTPASIMASSKPPPRASITDIHRLPIRVVGPGGKGLLVDCPRRGSEVHVDRCALCAACTGLSIRDRYLVCVPAPDTPDSDGNEPPGQADAPLASEAQILRRRACRVGWFGAELPLLEDGIEGNVAPPESS